MEFETFLKKFGQDYDPDRAYKLYLQAQLTIIQEILIAKEIITRESLDRIEERILNNIAEKADK